MYQINTIIFSFRHDPAPERPAVVLEVPPEGSTLPIRVVTRTSDGEVPGVKHPLDPDLHLDKDGVFSDLVTIEQELWRPGNVELLGELAEPYWSEVGERFS